MRCRSCPTALTASRPRRHDGSRLHAPRRRQAPGFRRAAGIPFISPCRQGLASGEPPHWAGFSAGAGAQRAGFINERDPDLAVRYDTHRVNYEECVGSFPWCTMTEPPYVDAASKCASPATLHGPGPSAAIAAPDARRPNDWSRQSGRDRRQLERAPTASQDPSLSPTPGARHLCARNYRRRILSTRWTAPRTPARASSRRRTCTKLSLPHG